MLWMNKKLNEGLNREAMASKVALLWRHVDSGYISLLSLSRCGIWRIGRATWRNTQRSREWAEPLQRELKTRGECMIKMLMFVLTAWRWSFCQEAAPPRTHFAGGVGVACFMFQLKRLWSLPETDNLSSYSDNFLTNRRANGTENEAIAYFTRV